MSRPYVAFVRKHHPQGWDHPFWAGTTRREGNRRATDVCRHQHTSEADALRCAQHLADLRNTMSWQSHALVKCGQCRGNYTDKELS